MRYLILSDIHANLTALDAALEAAKGQWEKAACLGDLVGYGPEPNEVIDRVRSLDAVVIRGNHDKAVSGLVDAEDFNPLARSVTLWTRDQLLPANLEYLRESAERARSRSMAFRSFTARFTTKTNMSSAPRRRSRGCLTLLRPYFFRAHAHPGRLYASRRSGRRAASEAGGGEFVRQPADRKGNILSAESRARSASLATAIRAPLLRLRTSIISRSSSGESRMILKRCRTAWRRPGFPSR